MRAINPANSAFTGEDRSRILKGYSRVFVLGSRHAEQKKSWPGLDKICPPGDIVTKGLSYGLTCQEFENRLSGFNPTDNLAPLAKANIKIYHIHGDADDLVPIQQNTYEFQKRYEALGGKMIVEVVRGGNHGNPVKAFFESKAALDFLLGQ